MADDNSKLPPSAKAELQRRARLELWKKGELSWKLHSGQLKIHQALQSLDRPREVLLFISRRYGKSYYGVIKALETCLKKPGCNVLICGPTEKQSRRIVTPLINQITSDAPEGLVTPTKSEGIWTVGKSTIMVHGYDTAIENLRGMSFDLIISEETGSMRNIEDYQYIIVSVLRPTLMHSKGMICHLTTPSKLVNHPLHTITIPKTKLANSFFKLTIEDNPLLTLEDIEQEIAEMGGRESVHCQRELFCEIVRDSSLVAVPEFQVDKHVKEVDLPSHAFKWVSGDFGGVRDKSVFHMMLYDFKNDLTHCVEELVFSRNTPTSQIVAEIREMEKRWEADADMRYIDCPGQIRVDLSRDHNFHLSILRKEKGSFEAGLNQLSVAFRQNRLIIHPRCKFTSVTLETGMLNEQRSDFARTEDLGHCDAIASLSYGWRNKITENPYPAYDHLNGLPEHKRHRVNKEVANSHPLSKIMFE